MKLEKKDEWSLTQVAYNQSSNTSANSQGTYTTSTDLTVGSIVNTTDGTITTDHVFWNDNQTVPYGTTWYYPPAEGWPEVEGAIGIIYVDDNKIKIKTKSGEDIVIADISEGQTKVTVNLLAVIAKKKLEESQPVESE